MSSQRVALVGIDGFSPVWMERFLKRGKLPSIARLASSGATGVLRSTLPATTPVAWATVATGCSPRTSGIDANLLHRQGERLDRRNGCFAHRCLAEPIWATAARQDKRSIVVKFPVSYPSDTASFRLDGAAGWAGLKCLHEVSSADAAELEQGGREGALLPSPVAWLGDHEGHGAILWRGRWVLDNLWGRAPLTLFASVVAPLGQAPRVVFAQQPDWSRTLATLNGGEWSEALILEAEGRRGPTAAAFRIKVLEVGGQPLRLRLFHTTVHELRGHSHPAATWDRLLGRVGPIEEQTDPFVLFRGGIDLDTQSELFSLNAAWLGRASRALLDSEPWDLFMVQLHFTDWAHHMLQGGLDPRHADFDPTRAAQCEARLESAYQLADRVVGEVASALTPNDNLIVLGDHGQDLHHTTFHVNEWLARQRLLCWEDGSDEVDWRRTQAFAAGNFVYLNLEGREPTGIVPAARADELVSKITDGLLGAHDHEARARPILIAGPKEHFEPFGADGPGAGDVIFVCRSGYQARNSRGPLFSRTRLLTEFTSGHDHFWPFDPQIETLLFAGGPGIRRGAKLSRTASLADVAPTLCSLLRIAPPPAAEGHALTELFAAEPPADLEPSTTPWPLASPTDSLPTRGQAYVTEHRSLSRGSVAHSATQMPSHRPLSG